MFQPSRSKQREDDLHEEIRAYVALTEDEKIASGMIPAEAHRLALAEAGGAEQIKQAVRDSRSGVFWQNLLQDVTVGARQLRRNPAYAVIAVLTLALGLGAIATMGSLVWSVLLRPLPFSQQEQLVSIGGWYPKGWVRAVAERTHTLSGVMSYSIPMEHNVQSSAGPERIFLSTVTSNAFDVLGVAPVLGRAFRQEEAIAGRDHAVLLSEEYWRDHLGADPNVLGKGVRIDGEVYSIIGVLPRGLNFPTAEARLWIPVSFKPGDGIDPWAMFTGSMIGRMRPGVTPEAVQAEVHALHPELLRLFPWRMPDQWYADVTVTSLLSATAGDTRPRILLLFAASVLLLIVACCNVASLMVERASQRSGEFAIRGALGAPTKRLIRQLLTESLLLG
ncbi:MAG: ABC transporter permease, partial [Rhodospirillales bacterium]|nr:ABC transporter permease [Acetobacter sp.]